MVNQFLCKHILFYLEEEEYDKLNDAQHGFRKGRPCLNVFVSNNLSEDKATCVDMVYLDYAEDSNTVERVQRSLQKYYME